MLTSDASRSRRCKALNRQGQPCGQPPLLDGDYCFAHDPESRDAAQEARKLGGRRRRREGAIAGAFDFQGLADIPQIRRLLEVAAIDALNLDNSVARVRALAYLVQTAVKLLEVGEHEQRLQALEDALERKKLYTPGSHRR